MCTEMWDKSTKNFCSVPKQQLLLFFITTNISFLYIPQSASEKKAITNHDWDNKSGLISCTLISIKRFNWSHLIKDKRPIFFIVNKIISLHQFHGYFNVITFILSARSRQLLRIPSRYCLVHWNN